MAARNNNDSSKDRPKFDEILVSGIDSLFDSVADGLVDVNGRTCYLIDRGGSNQKQKKPIYDLIDISDADISHWRKHNRGEPNSKARKVSFNLIRFLEDVSHFEGAIRISATNLLKLDAPADKTDIKPIISWLKHNMPDEVERLRLLLGDYLASTQILPSPLESNQRKPSQVSRRPEFSLLPSGQRKRVNRIEFSECGRFIAVCDDSHVVHVYRSDDLQEPVSLSLHKAAVYSASFSDNGDMLATASIDRTVVVWCTRNWRPVCPPFALPTWVTDVDIMPDGSHFVATSDDTNLYLCPVEKNARASPIKGHSGYVRSVNFSRCGKFMVSGSSDCSVRVWELNTVRLQADTVDLFDDHNERVYDAVFVTDRKKFPKASVDIVASASVDGGVRVFKTGKGTRKPEKISTRHSDWVNSICVSADGGKLLTCSEDKTARIWDWKNDIELECITDQDQRLRAVRFSPDEQHVVTGGYEGKVNFWKNSTV